MPYGVCIDCWGGRHDRCDGRCGCRLNTVLSRHHPRVAVTPDRPDDELLYAQERADYEEG